MKSKASQSESSKEKQREFSSIHENVIWLLGQEVDRHRRKLCFGCRRFMLPRCVTVIEQNYLQCKSATTSWFAYAEVLGENNNRRITNAQ